MNDTLVPPRSPRAPSLALALVALLLGACGPGNEERVTQLVPLAPEVVALQKEIADSPGVDFHFEPEYAGRVRMRAIECARGRSFPWWIPDADVREALAPTRECFAVADAALLQWLRRRQVGLRLAEPALATMPDKPAPTLGDRNPMVGMARHVAFADAAGVAAVAYEGAIVAYDTNQGSVVGSLVVPNAGPLALSPNGRVIAVSVEGNVHLRGVDGADFGVLDAAAQGRTWWLSPTVLAYNDARDDSLHVVDFASARAAHVPELTGLHGVVPVRDSPGRVFALARQGAALIVVPPEGSP